MSKAMKYLLRTAVVVVVLIAAGVAWFLFALLHRSEGKYFDANGLRIHYTDEGEGAPVILLHGLGVNSHVNWRSPGIVQRLAQNHRVVAMDHRGHGLSEKPHDPAKYGVEMVEDVVRLMDHLGIRRAHIVGYSMGGFIALKLLTTHPERFLTATIAGAGYEAPSEEDRAFFTRLAESIESGDDYSALFVRLQPIGRPVGSVGIRVMSWLMSLLNDPQAIAAVARSFFQFAVDEEKLRHNSVPVLQICGTLDPLRAGVERLSGLLQDEDMVWIEGGDHISTIRRPELREAIVSFLK